MNEAELEAVLMLLGITVQRYGPETAHAQRWAIIEAGVAVESARFAFEGKEHWIFYDTKIEAMLEAVRLAMSGERMHRA